MPQYTDKHLRDMGLTDEEIADLDVIHDTRCILVQPWPGEDLYMMEREHHPNTTTECIWIDSQGRRCSSPRYSKWLSPDCGIEGTKAEWLAIANAIRHGYTEHFKRCAVIIPSHIDTKQYFEYELPEDCIGFESPRNSNCGPFLMTEEAALYFADKIEKMFA